MNWKIVGDIAFYGATAASVVFALLYFTLAPWRSTVAGRNIMAVMGSVAVTFAYFSWAITVGGVPAGFDAVRALLFAGVATSITWRTVIFVKHHVLRSLHGPDPEGDSKDELENAR